MQLRTFRMRGPRLRAAVCSMGRRRDPASPTARTRYPRRFTCVSPRGTLVTLIEPPDDRMPSRLITEQFTQHGRAAISSPLSLLPEPAVRPRMNSRPYRLRREYFSSQQRHSDHNERDRHQPRDCHHRRLTRHSWGAEVAILRTTTAEPASIHPPRATPRSHSRLSPKRPGTVHLCGLRPESPEDPDPGSVAPDHQPLLHRHRAAPTAVLTRSSVCAAFHPARRRHRDPL